MSLAINLLVAGSLRESALPESLKTENADIHHLVFERFGIDEARELRAKSSTKAFGTEPHTFVIFTRDLTLEAQNSLLKLTEDPPTSLSLYLIIPSESLLIPTLRSRFVMAEGQTKKVGNTQSAEEFLALSYAERLLLVADKVKQKDQAWIDNLLFELYESRVADARNKEAKKSLLLAITYMRNRGASKKQLLEELALSLPVG